MFWQSVNFWFADHTGADVNHTIAGRKRDIGLNEKNPGAEITQRRGYQRKD
jgi:hypothetical protein